MAESRHKSGEKIVSGEGTDTSAPRQFDSVVSNSASEPAVVHVYPFGWSRYDLKRFVGLSLSAVIAAMFLWSVQSILPPFLIAFFLAALFDPTLREFEKHGRSRTRGIITLYLGGICFVVIAGMMIIPRAVNQAADISQNIASYTQDIQASADAFIHQHRVLLDRVGVPHESASRIVASKAEPLKKIMAGTLIGVTGALQSIASRALWLVIIPLSAFFFMRDYPSLRARIITQFPEQYHARIDTMSCEVMDVFTAYLRGLGKICTLYMVVAGCLYSVLGLQYSLVLGVLVGIFYAVPYVGQLFTAVATGLIAYQMRDHTLLFFIKLNIPQHSLAYTIAVVLTAVVVQNVFDQVLYPRIVGGSVGLHPVASIFALMAGATLFGIWGMLFAVPVAASIQIIIMYFFPKVKMAPDAALLTSCERDSEPAS